MHIVDGVLAPQVLAAGAACSLLATAKGLSKLKDDKLVVAAMLCACFFVASFIRVPLGPSSVHLIFNGLLGLLLGWAVFPVVLIALLLQVLFFGFGGLTVLGANLFNIALPALLVGTLLKRFALPRLSKHIGVVGFIAGFTSVFLTSVLVALSLALSGQGFVVSAKLVVASHLPVAALEGLILSFTLKLLLKVRPEILALAEDKGADHA